MPRQSRGPRLIKRKNKSNWFIRYIDEKSGKQKDFSTGLENRSDAEEALEEFLRLRRIERTGQAVKHNEFSVAQALDDYAYHKLDSKAAARLGYSMVHLLNFWQDQTIDHVNIETIERYRRYRLKMGHTQSTARRELIDLRSALNHPVGMKRVFPIAFPKLPTDSQPKTRWITRSEFAQLLCQAGNNRQSKFNLRLFLIIAYYTGARKASIMSLRWDDINFDNNMINFRGKTTEITNKRKAYIPMAPQIVRFLKRRAERYKHLTQFVFHRKNNPSKQVTTIDKSYRAAAKQAGLSGVTPHTLKHTRISLLLQNGESPIAVGAYTATSLPTIHKTYAHHSNKGVIEMSQRVGNEKKSKDK